MGMDLEPIKPAADYPRHPADDKYEPNAPVWGRFNWSGWSTLLDFLTKHKCRHDEMSGLNDGDVISDSQCKAIGQCIIGNAADIPEQSRAYYLKQAELFLKSGGFRQW